MINEAITQIVNAPWASAAIVGNLVLLESMLSVDNAAVLATMVKDLPEHQRAKALKYGIMGAYVFRGLAMLFASILIKIWWLKPLGGLYLLYLVFDWYKGKQTEEKDDDLVEKKNKWLYRNTVGLIGVFWSTVILVEFMDMAFSIDNVFAAVAFTPNIILICTGVFIGILAMRFIAQWFVKLMGRYPFLETSAFVVIFLLALKLLISIYSHLNPEHSFSKLLESHTFDMAFSVLTAVIFFLPIIWNSINSKKLEVKK